MKRKGKEISETTKKADAERKLKHQLNSIKNDFVAGKVQDFEQIFAIIGPSIWAKLMHMGYNTFTNKADNPGTFSNDELLHFADIIDVDINLIVKFIFIQMKFKNRFKDGEAIRL